MVANLAACRISGRGDLFRVLRDVLHEPEALKKTIKLTDQAAAVLLDADVRGDPQVFGRSCGPIGFLNVVCSYWGSPPEQTTHTQRMHQLARRSARDLPTPDQEVCQARVLNAFRDYVLGDAAAVCLLRNKGAIGDIPPEALAVLTQHSPYNPENVVNVFAPGNEADAVRWYRELQATLFSQVLLMVFHKGNQTRVDRDLPSIKQSVLVYQLATDLLHKKNLREPTYEVVRNQRGLSKHQFAIDEARALSSGSLRQRTFGAMAFVAAGALCGMSKQAEWEQPRA